jgi:hypothetical protein
VKPRVSASRAQDLDEAAVERRAPPRLTDATDSRDADPGAGSDEEAIRIAAYRGAHEPRIIDASGQSHDATKLRERRRDGGNETRPRLTGAHTSQQSRKRHGNRFSRCARLLRLPRNGAAAKQHGATAGVSNAQSQS